MFTRGQKIGMHCHGVGFPFFKFILYYFFFVSLLPKETDVSKGIIQVAKAPVETHSLSELNNLKPECGATTDIRNGKEITDRRKPSGQGTRSV